MSEAYNCLNNRAILESINTRIE
uniref:Transposase n=1 Tax=Arundo donax TaxID=35708 RepID=A0A0A8ZB74_ARUDO